MSHGNFVDVQARMQAIQDSIRRHPHQFEVPKDDLGRALAVSDYFGSHTFGVKEIKAVISSQDYERFLDVLHTGKHLEKDLADKIAKAVKNWAMEMGVTHFCHWFQPMTGLTAEKHDAFLSFADDGSPVEKFSGSQLIQSEPDASSFPSGGVRATFEARGYTAWDPMSPMFIMHSTNGKTLCIPSAFISYHGGALDEKTPLLRASEALNKYGLELIHLLGETNVTRVYTTLGAEQEYFLIDKAFYTLRPDLIACGRTLVGAPPTKGQQLEDHYFGSIPSRVAAYMQEVEYELYRLGVPAKTRHNEVAPAQYEIAPIFEETSISVDHNHLTMEILKRVAERHNFTLLLHEKPFAGINGTGKHNNWSMSTDTGINLLDPGETPHQNLRFLTMLAVVLKGVHKHNALLRASIASPGNDHRLGANEAPPAIVSMFLGDELNRILNKIESGEEIRNAERAMIDLGVSKLPKVAKDNTDRNRTSPFAFTGNKFEFRAVGGSASCSFPMVTLNAAVTEAMREVAQTLREKFQAAADKEQVILNLVRDIVVQTKAIRFEGNNYSEEWVREAERRGLTHLKNTPEALTALKMPSTQKLFTELKILSAEELKSRINVSYERYIKKIEIETDTMRMLLDTYIVPAVSEYLSDTAIAGERIAKVGGTKSTQEKIVKEASALLEELLERREKMDKTHESIRHKGSEEDYAKGLAEKVMPAMLRVREVADQLECLTGNGYWPLPKYREILFSF